MLGQIAERPGGVTAQTIRASNVGRSGDEFIPPYVGEGMSVNLGGDKYLSGLGLPTDQFSDLLVKGPTALGTISRTGQKAIATMNPLIKGPLEAVFNQNTFTGRPLTESHQYPTGDVLTNQTLHNLPISRLMTSIRTLEDPRKDKLTKAMNLGTGVRITDVSGGLEKNKRMAEQKIIQEIAREYPQVGASTDIYVKKDQATGKPLEIPKSLDDLMRTLQHLKAKAAAEAKKKAKQLQTAP